MLRKTLTGCIALIALWFVGNALYQLAGYIRLGSQAPAQSLQFVVRERSSSHYLIEVLYSYQVEGVSYQGTTLFPQPVYLNRYSAEGDLPKWEKISWQTWYQKTNPQNSSLHRDFPMKALIRALLSIGVFLYLSQLFRVVKARPGDFS